MPSDKNWSAFKVPELKSELSARGLPATGNKADLVARLQADDKKKMEEAAAVSAPPVATTVAAAAPAAPAAVPVGMITSHAALFSPISPKILSIESRTCTSIGTTISAEGHAAQAQNSNLSKMAHSKQSPTSTSTSTGVSASAVCPAPTCPSTPSAPNSPNSPSTATTRSPVLNHVSMEQQSVSKSKQATVQYTPVDSPVAQGSDCGPISPIKVYKSSLTWDCLSLSPAEDEIDWEDDDAKPAEKVVQPAAPAAAKPAEPTKVEEPAIPESAAPESVTAEADVEETTPNSAEPDEEKKGDEKPKQDFAAGLAATSADDEARKRAERAKRFGIELKDEDQKKASRAEKFGLDSNQLTKGLDAALPERGPKRSRGQGADDGRPAKRPTPDRRGPGGRVNNGRYGGGRARGGDRDRRGPPTDTGNRRDGGSRRGGGRSGILSDPTEKAKAEARAKRFAA